MLFTGIFIASCTISHNYFLLIGVFRLFKILNLRSNYDQTTNNLIYASTLLKNKTIHSKILEFLDVSNFISFFEGVFLKVIL